MKTYFAEPELKVIQFDAVDVLTSSTDGPVETDEDGLPIMT